MSSAYAIAETLPPDLYDAAVRLYWHAFGPKLGRVLGPEERALAFLRLSLRPDHGRFAIGPGGQLLGLAGFKTFQGSFVGGGYRELRAVFGRVGAIWRLALLAALSREVENRRFLMDGLCVADGARGQGVGRALIAAICDEARCRGYDEVRLDVVDTNLRARALYEREGFVALRTVHIGLLRHAFGFRSATTMVRRVTPTGDAD